MLEGVLAPQIGPIVVLLFTTLILVALCARYLRAIRKELERIARLVQPSAPGPSLDSPLASELRAKGFNDDQIELILKK